MNNFEEIDVKKVIIIAIIIVICVCGAGYMIFFNKNNSEDNFEQVEMFEGNNTVSENISKEEKQEEEKTIAVHITGEVKNKGIIYLKSGQRIVDAIKKAGGTTKNANLDKVNLAYILEDGQKIYIPNKNDKDENYEYISSNSGNNIVVEESKSNNAVSASSTSKSKGVDGKVNINMANESELESLPGIGPSLAQRIMEYRQEQGRFNSIEDVQNVKGIGDAKFSKIKEYITTGK